MEIATLQGGALEGIDSVRILATSNRTRLIPIWVTERAPQPSTTSASPEGQSENFLNVGDCMLTQIMDDLWEHGFRPVRTHRKAGKGDQVRVAVTFMRKGKPLSQTRLAELAPCFEGTWNVRGDRNPPTGRVPDSIVLNCHYRGKGTERFNMLGVTEEGVIAAF